MKTKSNYIEIPNIGKISKQLLVYNEDTWDAINPYLRLYKKNETPLQQSIRKKRIGKTFNIKDLQDLKDLEKIAQALNSQILTKEQYQKIFSYAQQKRQNNPELYICLTHFPNSEFIQGEAVYDSKLKEYVWADYLSDFMSLENLPLHDYWTPSIGIRLAKL